MKRVDLHPDELLDRARAGHLTYEEGQRLRAHMEGCAPCALELAWTADGLHAQAPSERDLLRAHTAIAQLWEEPDRPSSVQDRKRPAASRLAPAAAVALVLSASVAAAAFGESGKRWILERVASWPNRGGDTSAAPHASKRRARLPRVRPSPSAAPIQIAQTPPLESQLASELEAAAASPESTVSSRSASPDPLASANPVRHFSDSSTRAQAALTLLTEAHRARALGQYDRALELYLALARRYPESHAARASRVSLANLLLDQAGDAAQALQLYQRYVSRPSPGPLLQEALVGRARALERLGRREQALAAWREFVTTQPESIHVRLARERIAELDP